MHKKSINERKENQVHIIIFIPEWERVLDSVMNLRRGIMKAFRRRCPPQDVALVHVLELARVEDRVAVGDGGQIKLGHKQIWSQ